MKYNATSRTVDFGDTAVVASQVWLRPFLLAGPAACYATCNCLSRALCFYLLIAGANSCRAPLAILTFRNQMHMLAQFVVNMTATPRPSNDTLGPSYKGLVYRDGEPSRHALRIQQWGWMACNKHRALGQG